MTDNGRKSGRDRCELRQPGPRPRPESVGRHPASPDTVIDLPRNGWPVSRPAALAAGVPEERIREAWLRAEACCECAKESHGHPGRCNQFLVWAARGGTGKGAWEARPIQDPRRPPCDILCAVCYTKATGRVPRNT